MYDYILSIDNLHIALYKSLFYKMVNSVYTHVLSTVYLQDNILDPVMKTKLNKA